MAIGLVQTGDSGTGDTASGYSTPCLSSNTTPGNTVVFLVNLFSGDSIESITSPMGTCELINAVDAGGGLYLAFCKCLVVTGASTDVTITTTEGMGYYVQASEWSGVAAVNWAGDNSGTDTSPTLEVSCTPGDGIIVGETASSDNESYPGSPWGTYTGDHSYVYGGQNSMSYQVADSSPQTATWSIA